MDDRCPTCDSPVRKRRGWRRFFDEWNLTQNPYSLEYDCKDCWHDKDCGTVERLTTLTDATTDCCPTCGSDKPEVRLYMMHESFPPNALCIDPYHDTTERTVCADAHEGGTCIHAVRTCSPDSCTSFPRATERTDAPTSAEVERHALVRAWQESNRKMDNAAHRGDMAAYMRERRANVKAVKAVNAADQQRIATLEATLRTLDDAGALAKTLGCSCTLTRFHDATRGGEQR